MYYYGNGYTQGIQQPYYYPYQNNGSWWSVILVVFLLLIVLGAIWCRPMGGVC